MSSSRPDNGEKTVRRELTRPADGHDPWSSRPAPGHGRATAALPTVPGYAVVGEIARGGMGVVLAARDLAL
ncbi:MAG: hypothetical protein K2V38_17670, partial [Gemmataceae bacterium]|nr:hypothetical protein [Gemmataceae bacterium]